MHNRSSRTDPVGLQVTRRRRGGTRVRRPLVAAGAAAGVLAVAGVTYASTQVFGHNRVGTEYAQGLQISDDQILKPLGDRLVTQVGKFMGSTVSPNGRFLAATSTDRSVALQIFDLSTYKLVWTVGTAATVNQRFSNGTVGQEGPAFSPDGNYLWVPQQTSVSRFPVNGDGTLGTPTTISIPAVNGHAALVGQIRYSPDGSTVFA